MNVNANLDAVLPRYQFRTSPFSPTIGTSGPIQAELFDYTFDPMMEPKTLPYYFDLYDWGRRNLFNGFSEATIFQQSPPARPPQPLLIVVSGNSATGRTSLINRIVKKIADDVGAIAPPLPVNVRFGGQDRGANMFAMADMLAATFQIEYDTPVLTNLATAIQAAIPSPTTTLDTYVRLFDRIALFLPRLPRRTIVYLLSGVDDFKTWAACFDVARVVATYVIIETGSATESNACMRLMIASGRGSTAQHIRANQLTRESARQYLVERLDAEREEIAALGRLVPFTEAALDGLFAPGTETAGGTVSLPIWRVRKTLRLALELHADSLVEYGRIHGEPALRALPINEKLISRTDMQRASDIISSGRAS